MSSSNSSIPQGYKQTKVGVIPEDWEVKRLGQLCTKICGEYGANEKAIQYLENLPRYIRITDIDEVGNLYHEPKVSANLSDEEIKKYELFHNDLLFARTGATVGKTYLHKKSNTKMVYAGFLIRFRLNSNLVNPKFIKEFTNTNKYWGWINAFSARSGQPGINSSEYKLLKLPIPPLDEQEKIANCLTTWDNAIEKLTKLIEAKKQIKKGLMQQLLTGKKRLDGFTEDWKEVRLGDIAKIKTGKLNANAMVYNGKYKFFTCAKESYQIDNYAYDTEALLISGNGANVGYVHYYKGKFNAYQRTYILYNFTQNILFVKYLLDINLSRRISIEKNEGNTPYIVLSTLKLMKLNLPSIKEQEAIAEILQASDREIELLEQKLKALEIQKKGLMQVLLTGKKRLV